MPKGFTEAPRWTLPTDQGPTEPANVRRPEELVKATAAVKYLQEMINEYSTQGASQETGGPIHKGRPLADDTPRKTLNPRATTIMQQRLQSYQRALASATNMSNDEEAVIELMYIKTQAGGDIHFLRSALDLVRIIPGIDDSDVHVDWFSAADAVDNKWADGDSDPQAR